MNVAIGKRGAIVFPNDLCVDGHENGCVHRFVTHVHADHITDIDKSITYSKLIIATPITIDLLKVMGFQIPLAKTLKLDYGQSIDISMNRSAIITVAKADHIPGSAQVAVELSEGSVGYTGDFKNPGAGTDILKGLDVLVIDATYGDPSYSRDSEDAIMNEFVKLVRKLLTEGPIAVYAYYGKINEVMLKLRNWGVDAPFILPLSQWSIYSVLAKHGYNVADVYPENCKEAEEIRRTKWYIEFHLSSRFNFMKRRRGLSHILLTGRYGKTVMRKDDAWIVGISGHADFKELVYYVDEARPRMLIVDGYRSSHAHTFSSYVSKTLGIKSIALPS